MSEAQQAEAALATASGPQADLVRWLAARQPNGQFEIPDAAWVENFLAVTSDLTPAQVERLKQAEWVPTKDMTAEEMRARIDSVLAAGAPDDQGEASPDTPKRAPAPAPSPRVTAPQKDKTTGPDETLAMVQKSVRDFDYSGLRDGEWTIAGEKAPAANQNSVLYYVNKGEAFGADIAIDRVTKLPNGKVQVTVRSSRYVVRKRDGSVSPSKWNGAILESYPR
jgi:hypothetical protein